MVQLIQKVGRINTLVKSIGVGSSEREIELLKSIARLELENRLRQRSLFYEPVNILIDSFVTSLYYEDISLEGPDLVFGSL